ncbi:uncharacterized protein [Venturia canescens]|uniref:uncharacterized protein n=1 Tax=Venturia canescens TaxID=32260 RepID=UPI001C9C2A4D|nr:uncharacterized protein LOC122405707 [Venturia canescens]
MDPMSGTDDWEVVYFSLRSMLRHNGDHYISQLIAKREDDTFSYWIKPPKGFVPPTVPIHGLRFQGSEVFRNNEKLPTVSLKIAIKLFRVFLTTPPKPILLVSYFGPANFGHLVQAFKKTDTAHLFIDVIAGFSDTLFLFEQKLPYIKKLSDLTVPVLVREVLNRNYEKQREETLYDLDTMEELVNTAIPKREIILNSYERGRAVMNELRGPRVPRNFRRPVTRDSLAVGRQPAANPGPSSSTHSTEAFQQPNYVPNPNRFQNQQQELIDEIYSLTEGSIFQY